MRQKTTPAFAVLSRRIARQDRLYDLFWIILIICMTSIAMMILSLPFYAIWTYHSRKLEELKAKQKVEIGAETRKAIEQIRQEVSALRDTATTYDLSFDTSLQRLENRMANMELRMGRVETSVTQPRKEEEQSRAANL